MTGIPVWKRGMTLAHAVYALLEEAGLGKTPDGTRILGGDTDPATPGGHILHVIDPGGIAPEVSIPLADSIGTASWQRLAP